MAGDLLDNEEEITGINVTPLVDVMLVLLIIFMVTTTYIVHRSIQIKLPKAQTADKQITTKNLAFIIDKNSNIYLDGKLISYKNISNKINFYKQQQNISQPKLQALISADRTTPHGQVIKLIDTIRKNGIIDFAIDVELAPKVTP
jgi:biopolymer transport protein TolR